MLKGSKAKSNSKLGKSHKKKLEKLKEEEKKAILLSESLETMAKYKIGDNAYSLMWSSSNLGQAETTREKRRREVQYSKAGLEVPSDDRPSKKKSILCDAEQESDGMQCTFVVNDCPLQSPVSKDVSDTSSYLGTSHRQNKPHAFDGDSFTPVRHATDETNEPLMPKYMQNPLSTSSCHDEEKTGIMVGVDENQKAKLADCHPPRSFIAPTVVHVSRPTEVENKRKDLPIVMMEQEIMEAINENTCVIICGETGCGKTTQVPQFLYEAGFGSQSDDGRGGIIGVTQPRRVAVLATAKRVAFELGFHIGKEVGFQVRHDRKVGDNCSIKFMTDGILLREVQNDFLLRRYSVIILDEAHERSLNTDILVGMLSRVIRERQREYAEQHKKVMSGGIVSCKEKIYPLKLVLMSATLRVEDFVSGGRIFHDPPPVIEVPTRQYPVTTHFSKRTEIVDYVGQAYKKVLSIHKRLPAGGILVFVTGQREVEFLCQKLCKASKEIVEKNCKEKNEALSVTALKPTEEKDMQEINEAFEVNENSSHEITDRFNSYDEEHGDTYEDESDMSYDSEDDSDLEVSSDGEDLLNQHSLDSDGKLAVPLGEDGNLTSLKAAFEALAGKKAFASGSTGREVAPVTAEGESNASSSQLSNNLVVPSIHRAGPMCVLPLYAMLPASAQLRVFEEVKEGERLIVVATNVAETSLTIPGIKYVVDTGREKVKRYNSSNGMETYEVQWISKASAAQRAGRAGRTGPGHCYRLYSSAVFNDIFSPFSDAEILKVPVDGVVLLMKSMHIGKVANFPFPTPPEPTALVEAERCLKVLEALDVKGRLTPLGKVMSQFPMSPRHSRMLLTVIQMMQKVKDYTRANTVLAYAVAAAAALSLSNPFVMEFEQTQSDPDGLKQECERSDEKEEKLRKKKLKEAARVSRAKFLNPTSDALTIACALQCFELSGNSAVFCIENALHLKTMEEMSKLRKQLLRLVFNSKCEVQEDFSWSYGTIEDVEAAWRVCSNKHALQSNEEEILGQAIYAGWADRVAKRTKRVSGPSERDRKVNALSYQACMVNETVFLNRRSSVSKSAPEFLVYSELLHSKRPYIHGATSVKANWLVKYGQSLCSFSAPLTDPKPYYCPLADRVFCWVDATFGPHLWELPRHSLPIEDNMKRVAVFAYALLEGQVLPCLKAVRKFMAASPASILRPEALGSKRVGNLLNRLNSRGGTIDSCAMLKKLWEMNPRELFPEIMDWFQEGFHDQFEALWTEMLFEIHLNPKDRFSKKIKRQKKGIIFFNEASYCH
nr:ATP-dependent RNA helicase DEAH13 isoform X1 [Ipomoea batatas]